MTHSSLRVPPLMHGMPSTAATLLTITIAARPPTVPPEAPGDAAGLAVSSEPAGKPPAVSSLSTLETVCESAAPFGELAAPAATVLRAASRSFSTGAALADPAGDPIAFQPKW